MLRDYRLYILSLFLININNFIAAVETDYGIPKIFKYLLTLVIIGTIISYKFLKPSRPPVKGLVYPILIVFLSWSIILLAVSSLGFTDLLYLQRALAGGYFFLPYLIPVLVLYTKFELEFFVKLFHYSFLLILPGIFVQLFIILNGASQENWVKQTSIIGIFNLVSVFLLLTSHISDKKFVPNVTIIFHLGILFLYLIYGRRGMVIWCILMLASMIYLRLKSTLLNFNDRMKIYFFGLVATIIISIFGYLLSSTYAFQRGFSAEGFRESRGGFEYFFYAFNSFKELILGRGIGGTITRMINQEEQIIDVIENGFLTIILKGGLLYLIPFLLILLRASYLGLFRSRNDLTKALACILGIHVLMMSYHMIPDLTAYYIFIWISVSVCLSPDLRDLTNEEVRMAINYKSVKSGEKLI